MSFFGSIVNGLAGLASGGWSIYKDVSNYYDAKYAQEETWRREDTAVQRRAADLEAAGLSKTLAAGSAASTNVVSPPQFEGNGALDALNGALAMQNVKNAREENANMRKSREVMNADIALKFGDMQKNFAQANYFNQQAATSAVDSQLKSSLILKAFQDIEESKERSKGYQYKAQSDYSNAMLHAWEAANAALDNSLINLTGQRSSVGGLAPALEKLFGRFSGQTLDALRMEGGRSTTDKDLMRGFNWKF